MTTIAALLGAVPLAFGAGIGLELRRPLGIAIIGGLILSKLLTLYTAPVIYITFGGQCFLYPYRWDVRLYSGTAENGDRERRVIVSPAD